MTLLSFSPLIFGFHQIKILDNSDDGSRSESWSSQPHDGAAFLSFSFLTLALSSHSHTLTIKKSSKPMSPAPRSKANPDMVYDPAASFSLPRTQP